MDELPAEGRRTAALFGVHVNRLLRVLTSIPFINNLLCMHLLDTVQLPGVSAWGFLELELRQKRLGVTISVTPRKTPTSSLATELLVGRRQQKVHLDGARISGNAHGHSRIDICQPQTLRQQRRCIWYSFALHSHRKRHQVDTSPFSRSYC